MVTVILPGYSSHNKQWLEETTRKINVDGEIRPIYWGHWTNLSKKFNPKDKASLIDDIAEMGMVNIIAMSIGTFVASIIIQKNPEKIHKVILNGICLNDLNDNEKEMMKKALKLVSSENIICFQNEEDPHGDYDQAKIFYQELTRI